MAKSPDKNYTDLFLDNTFILLKKYRHDLGLKQENIAPLFGIDRPAFSKFESDKRMLLWEFAALLKTYDVPLTKFAKDLAYQIGENTNQQEMQTDIIDSIIKFIYPPKPFYSASPKLSRMPSSPSDYVEDPMDHITEDLEMISVKPEKTPLEMEFFYEKYKRDFENHLLSKEASDKRELLSHIKALCNTAQEEQRSLSREKKTFIKASLRYIASHPDPYLKEEFKKYIKITETRYSEPWRR